MAFAAIADIHTKSKEMNASRARALNLGFTKISHGATQIISNRQGPCLVNLVIENHQSSSAPMRCSRRAKHGSKLWRWSRSAQRSSLRTCSAAVKAKD